MQLVARFFFDVTIIIHDYNLNNIFFLLYYIPNDFNHIKLINLNNLIKKIFLYRNTHPFIILIILFLYQFC